MFDYETLSTDQKAVVDSVRRGDNILITGPAGTGKTYLLNYLLKTFNIDTTATTGVAAVNVDGMTINCWSGVGTYQGTARKLYNKLVKRSNMSDTLERIRSCKILAIDECSMMSARHLELLDYIFKRVRENIRTPFGGIQIILCGDFLQLPPIFDNEHVDKNGEDDHRYPFESKVWREAGIKTHLLTTVFRQDNRDFIAMLHRMRVGQLTGEDIRMLSDFSRRPEPDERALRIFALNKRGGADTYNRAKMDAINHEIEILKATKTIFGDNWNYYRDFMRGSLVHEKIEIKPGCRIMVLKNMDFDNRIVNGTTATLKRIAKDKEGKPLYLSLELDDGRVYKLPRHVLIPKHKDKAMFRFTQFPIKLSWAVTIHKSQGMTLDRVMLDCRRIFETGQLYVGCSRVTSPEGLVVRNFDPSQLMVNQKALKFYENGAVA